MTAQPSATMSNLAETAVTTTTASFSFKAPAGATKVVLDAASNGGSTRTGSHHRNVVADRLPVTATGLTSGTAYEFGLVVTRGTYAGTSNVVSLTTTAAAPTVTGVSPNGGQTGGAPR